MPQSGNISGDFGIFSSLLEDDDDFYQTCQEFLKTVEMLPSSPQNSLPKNNICDSLSTLMPSKSDQLELMSKCLLDDEEYVDQGLLWDLEASLKMEQDCMWSNLLTTTELDKAGDKLDVPPLSSPLMSEIESQLFQDLCGSDFESITPFLDRPHQKNEDPNSDDESSLSTGSVSSRSSDSEEEIDVVTIEKQRLAVGGSAQQDIPRTGTRSQTLASIKRCNLEIQQQHNYAAPSPLLCKETPAPKRAKTDRYLHVIRYSSPSKSLTFSPRSSDAEDEERQRMHKSLTFSPRSSDAEDEDRRRMHESLTFSPRSSDAEDEERRRTHNVLERQRRNELKHCLLALRDEVPELSKNDKASKVVILRKATEYVIRLKREHQKLNSEREKLEKKQQTLRRKFDQMRGISK